LSEEVEILVEDLRDKLFKLLRALLQKGILSQAEYYDIVGE